MRNSPWPASREKEIRAEGQKRRAAHRQRSIRMNELAAQICSESDAEKLIDEVAEMFKEELPSVWTTKAVRTRLAHAEFKAATGVSSLIPEKRIVQVWNGYVREIGAPDEATITTAELHNLRDAHYSSNLTCWENDLTKSVWNIPNIVAVGNDGKVADGCRALETLRLLYSMGRFFENIRSTRQRVRLGMLMSDEPENRPENRKGVKFKYVLKAAPVNSPIRLARQQYIQEHGSAAFAELIAALLTALFSTEH